MVDVGFTLVTEFVKEFRATSFHIKLERDC